MSISCGKIFLLVSRYQDICLYDLDPLWNWPLSGAFVFHKHVLFFMHFLFVNAYLNFLLHPKDLKNLHCKCCKLFVIKDKVI